MDKTSPKKELAGNASHNDAGGEKPYIEKKDVWKKAKEEFLSAEEKEAEIKNIPAEEKEAIRQQIKREIEMMELTPELQDEAAKKAKKIEFLGEKEKLEHLLAIAEERGLVFAIDVAKNMNDPYVLDILHDILIREGLYKKFLKQ